MLSSTSTATVTGPPELPVPAAVAAKGAQKVAISIDYLDPAIVRVGDDHLAIAFDRHTFREAEFTLAVPHLTE
jgi:hypothetical protein